MLTLDRLKEYTERDVDDQLAFWLADIGRSIDFDRVSLRRWLVDTGYIEREKDGSSYRVGVIGPGQGMFEPDVEDVDVYEVIGLSMKQIVQRKQEHLTER